MDQTILTHGSLPLLSVPSFFAELFFSGHRDPVEQDFEAQVGIPSLGKM
jgi:hypothetical protein